jgi:uncharacterized membrane protein YoaK (UPF0700 family)
MNRPRHQVTTLIAITLTFGSGAMDVTSFTKLGTVFTSVMTGNIVLCGLAAARGSVSLITHTMTAFAGYVAGVASGARIGWYHSVRSASTSAKPDGSEGAWAPHVRATLIFELVLLLAFLIIWEIFGANPHGGAVFTLLAIAAAAMGLQASAVAQMGLTGVSTTYLTGTLTGLVDALANPGQRRRGVGVIRPGVLIGLATGALLSGLLVKTAPAAAPALPVTALVVVVILSSLPPGRLAAAITKCQIPMAACAA